MMSMAGEKKLSVARFEAHAAATDQLDRNIDTPVLDWWARWAAWSAR